MPEENSSRYQAPAATCAADVLLAIARSETQLTAGQIAELTGHSRSLVYRTAKSLANRRFIDEVERHGSVTFRLGSSAGEVGGAYQRAIPFQESIRAEMAQLSGETGETVSVGQLEGAEVRYLMREEGRHSVVALSHVGKRLPAHATGIGKALLSELSDEAASARFADGEPLRQLTARTISTVPALLADLTLSRARGYAIENGEVVQGRCCLAAPIQGHEVFGSPLAMSISMPEPRFAEEQETIAAALLEAVHRLEQDAANRRYLGGKDSLV